MHRDFNRPETQSRAVSSDGSVNVVLEPLDTETIVTHEEFRDDFYLTVAPVINKPVAVSMECLSATMLDRNSN